MTVTAGVAAAETTEREVRIDLAAAHRLAFVDDLSEGTWNHFTHRVPGQAEKMLMTPPDTHWGTVRASDLVVLDEDTEAARRLGPSSWAGYAIHYPLYRTRPDIGCILHTHAPYVTALGAVLGGRLEPATQHAVSLYNRVGYADEWADEERPEMRGNALAAALEDADILILNHHGVLVVGPTVGIAYTNLYKIERACRIQVLAMSTGRPLALVPDRYLERADRDESWKNGSFRGMRALLDATQADYAE